MVNYERINQASPRDGAALVMALAILAALVTMALPFLFSMTTGLAGSRTFKARTGQHRAIQHIGNGIAAEGTAEAPTDPARV